MKYPVPVLSNFQVTEVVFESMTNVKNILTKFLKELED